jgi:ATP-dependent protease HslVU (ClpYQ) peptidase subunit
VTTLAAVKDEYGVVIGADSRFTTGSRPMSVEKPKILRSGDALIGMAGLMMYMNVLTYNLGEIDHPVTMPDDEFVCSVLSGAIRNCLCAHGYEKATNDSDECMSLLVAYRGRFFRGNTLGLLYESRENYFATGSGGEYALGYLSATEGQPALERVRGALLIAEKYDTYTGSPLLLMRSHTPELHMPEIEEEIK